MKGINEQNQTEGKKEKTYRLSAVQYRKKLRDEERLRKLKVLVADASRITKQIK